MKLPQNLGIKGLIGKICRNKDLAAILVRTRLSERNNLLEFFFDPDLWNQQGIRRQLL